MTEISNQEFEFLKSENPETLWTVKEKIDLFYSKHASFFEEMDNEVDDMYTKQMADYILDCSMNIRTTYRCPPGWKEGLPWINMFPPVPQPEHMRFGVLATLANNSSMDKEVERPSETKKETNSDEFANFALSIKQRIEALITQPEPQMDADEEYEEDYEENEEMDIDQGATLQSELSSSSQNDHFASNNVSTIDKAPSSTTNEADDSQQRQRRVVPSMDFGNFGDDSDEED